VAQGADSVAANNEEDRLLFLVTASRVIKRAPDVPDNESRNLLKMDFLQGWEQLPLRDFAAAAETPPRVPQQRFSG
jgi:hypothetical protein